MNWLIVIKWVFIYILLSLLFWASAGYAYYVNSQLPDSDPKKRDFHPAAVNLVPFTWPVIIAFGIIYYIFLAIGIFVLFTIRSFFYLIFLILFTLALIFIRKPFFFIWLEKVARWVGGMLLAANTALIRLIQLPWVGNPQPI